MTDEELKYYKALQPLFKEKMGEWQNGDPYYCPHGEKIGYAHDYFAEEGKAYEPCCPGDVLHLPLPIDPVNPERGLWGMIDWGRWWVHHGKSLFEIDDLNNHFESNTPPLALLKTLAVQEGVEI